MKSLTADYIELVMPRKAVNMVNLLVGWVLDYQR